MATSLPPKSDFTGGSQTQGEVKTAINNLRDFLSGLLGTDGTAATAQSQLGLDTAATQKADQNLRTFDDVEYFSDTVYRPKVQMSEDWFEDNQGLDFFKFDITGPGGDKSTAFAKLFIAMSQNNAGGSPKHDEVTINHAFGSWEVTTKNGNVTVSLSNKSNNGVTVELQHATSGDGTHNKTALIAQSNNITLSEVDGFWS